MPLAAPVFQGQGWDAQVSELLTSLKPTDASEEALQKLVAVARRSVQTHFPQAEVFGFACGDISRGTAFGVAVPEVDILVQCSPEDLLRSLQQRLSKNVGCRESIKAIEERKIQKSAIRACTDILVNAGFKFRRSAFRGGEPKVTLLAPSTLGIFDKAVPVDFSVNIVTPVYNSALMTVASAIDPRVLELGLLVKRWAKDRGVCHAAKGHLPPYAWNLLTIFFLQRMGDKTDGNGMIPEFDRFDWSMSPVGNKKACISERTQSSWVVPEEFAGIHAPQLLKDFFHFYRYTLDWNTAVVSLHRPHSSAPKRMRATVITPPPGATEELYIPQFTFGEPPEAVLSIEDPWDKTRNLAADVTYFGMCRLKEELCRACNLIAENASVTELLEPWVPPERPEAKGSDDESPEGPNKEPSRPTKAKAPLAENKTQNYDALGAALFAELKARGEQQARKATEKLLQDLRTDGSEGGRKQKTAELISLLKDDEKLSSMVATNLL
eukprot:gnl/MRDRNA2_/MRDRNA2_130522_c0_seq1.p1 gnl/MRDRNA2_/MRDRNA2_130522_c0~~gnl/MRDRNA2_/MRDRNA2_130522_c0_seq1.p1  ORF type:complete len:524 (-),score=119.08 gnl/MRDRNA2_/MRDRNA2_130522_c0_seq1:144-1628(-)